MLGEIDSERQEVDLGKQSKIVFEAHPDYAQIAKTSEFQTWFDSAPKAIRDGVMRNAENVVDGAEVASRSFSRIERSIASAVSRVGCAQ